MCYHTTQVIICFCFIFKTFRKLKVFLIDQDTNGSNQSPSFNLKCVKVAKNMELFYDTGLFCFVFLTKNWHINSFSPFSCCGHIIFLHNSQSSCRLGRALHSAETSECTSQQSSRDPVLGRRHSVNNCSPRGHPGRCGHPFFLQ